MRWIYLLFILLFLCCESKKDISDKYLQEGNEYYEIGKWDEAFRLFSKAVEFDPKNSSAIFNLGQCKRNQEDYYGAIHYYTEVIDMFPNDTDAIYWRGVCKFHLNDIKGAGYDFNKVIELNPNDSDAYYYRAFVSLMENDFYGAIDDLNRAIKISKDAEYYWLRSEAYFELKNYELSLKDIDSCIGLEDGVGEYYLSRGNVKRMLLNIDGACLDYSKALKLGSSRAKQKIKEFCN